jgi:hypothetical protein
MTSTHPAQSGLPENIHTEAYVSMALRDPSLAGTAGRLSVNPIRPWSFHCEKPQSWSQRRAERPSS